MILLLLGCRPEPAPAEMEELCAYLFEHLDDERDRELEDGVANLDLWLRANGIEDEGLEVNQLSDAAVAELDGAWQHVAEGAVGAAVDDPITHPVVDVAGVLIEDDLVEVFPDTYESYVRDYVDDPDCFMAQDCARHTFENDFVAVYGGVITVETNMMAQFRWVELDGELALVQRGWLSGETEVSVDWASVEEQYFLMVALPRPEGTLRLQAVWIKAVLGEDAAPESAALNVMVNSMTKQSEEIQAWLDQ